MAATAVMLHLNAVNESIASGFEHVNKVLHKLVGYSESFFARCFDSGDEEEEEERTAAPPTESARTTTTEATTTEAPAQAAEELADLTPGERQQHRNRREDPPKNVFFPTGVPRTAEKTRRSAGAAVDVERFANATMSGLRSEFSKVRAMWTELLNSTMEGVRQELMQVPPMYISPVVERLEARVAGLEDRMGETNRIFQRAIDLVQIETRRHAKRVEEAINATAAASSCVEKRSAKQDFIYCEGRMIQDPCSIDRSNTVFAKALESSFTALELVVLTSSNALGGDVGLLKTDVDFLLKQVHRLTSYQDEIVAQKESTPAHCIASRLRNT